MVSGKITLLLVKNIHFFLSQFTTKLLNLIHSRIGSNFCLNDDKTDSILLPLLLRVVSSAKRVQSKFEQYEMSFIKIKNSIGANTEPCGTPRFKSREDETLESIFVTCKRLTVFEKFQ